MRNFDIQARVDTMLPKFLAVLRILPVLPGWSREGAGGGRCTSPGSLLGGAMGGVWYWHRDVLAPHSPPVAVDLCRPLDVHRGGGPAASGHLPTSELNSPLSPHQQAACRSPANRNGASAGPAGPAKTRTSTTSRSKVTGDLPLLPSTSGDRPGVTRQGAPTPRPAPPFEPVVAVSLLKGKRRRRSRPRRDRSGQRIGAARVTRLDL